MKEHINRISVPENEITGGEKKEVDVFTEKTLSHTKSIFKML